MQVVLFLHRFFAGHVLPQSSGKKGLNVCILLLVSKISPPNTHSPAASCCCLATGKPIGCYIPSPKNDLYVCTHAGWGAKSGFGVQLTATPSQKHLELGGCDSTTLLIHKMGSACSHG